MTTKMDLTTRIQEATRKHEFIHPRTNPDTGAIEATSALTAIGLLKKGEWKDPSRILVPEARMIGTAKDIKDYLLGKGKSGWTEAQVDEYIRNAITSRNFKTGEEAALFEAFIAERKENMPKKERSETPDLMGLMAHIKGVKMVDSADSETPTKKKGGSRGRTLASALEKAQAEGKVLNVTKAIFSDDGKYVSGAVAKTAAANPQSIFGTPSVPDVVANKDSKNVYKAAMKSLGASSTSAADKARFAAGAKEFDAGRYAGAAGAARASPAERSTRAPSRARATAARRSRSPARAASPVRAASPARAASPVRRSPSPARAASPVRTAGSPTGSPTRRRRTRVARRD